jgi:hypothetical protein
MLSNPASKLVWRERTTVSMVGLAMIVGLLMVGLLAPRAQAAPSSFIVNSTGDQNDLDSPSGPFDGHCDVDAATAEDQCTLRAAIQEANSNNNPTDQDQIIFDIPAESDPGCDSGSGVCTISPGSALEPITQRVTIDGYTQQGSKANTLAVGNDAVLNIELDGTNAGGIGLQLTNDAPNSVIRGLVINNFDPLGIHVLGSRNNQIVGNFIGTDPSGTQAEANANGVSIDGGRRNIIGGTTPESRNLISGNVGDAVEINQAIRNRVLGNYIGTTKDGTERLGNGSDGVSIIFSSNNYIGGRTATGANTIAYSGDNGVDVRADDFPFDANGNRFLINSIFRNSGLGIDLGDDGRTANDDGDTDTGPNGLQNFPVLSSATTISGTTTIEGTLNSHPNENYRVRFFSSPGRQGEKFIGEKTVTTDASGDATFTFSPTQAVVVGQQITATATRNTTGDTSEFSAAQQVAAS